MPLLHVLYLDWFLDLQYLELLWFEELVSCRFFMIFPTLLRLRIILCSLLNSFFLLCSWLFTFPSVNLVKIEYFVASRFPNNCLYRLVKAKFLINTKRKDHE